MDTGDDDNNNNGDDYNSSGLSTPHPKRAKLEPPKTPEHCSSKPFVHSSVFPALMREPLLYLLTLTRGNPEQNSPFVIASAEDKRLSVTVRHAFDIVLENAPVFVRQLANPYGDGQRYV